MGAFQYAIDQNMTTLEMDVVITKDEEVVVSHEPFLNHKICLDTAGNPITEELKRDGTSTKWLMKIYKNVIAEVLEIPDFPHQKEVSSPKPLLFDIIKKNDWILRKEGKELPHMNVEIKYEDGMQNGLPSQH